MTEKQQNSVILLVVSVGTIVGTILLSVCTWFITSMAAEVRLTINEQIRTRENIQELSKDVSDLAEQSKAIFSIAEGRQLTERVHALEMWKAAMSGKVDK